jgi:hypothetical protein
MSGARWWSQKYPPEGATTSEGIRRTLGTPALDPLAVLLRETAQNSWDARQSDSGIRLAYTLRTLTNGEAEMWRSLLLPFPSAGGSELDANLVAGSLVLVVSDRGTTGLGGPLRSDEVPKEQPDFVNFVRNVGEARDRAHGGGTYGFGKGILFRVSRPHAIVVDTQCMFAGGLQRRLMGASLGDAFVEGEHRYTGRHWWGRVDDDIPDPLLDADAEANAGNLGLPGFGGDERGTDIVIVAPDLGESEGRERTAVEAGRYIASAALWFLWPKLADRSGVRPIELSVTVDGKSVSIPDPAKVGRLRPFVESLSVVDRGEGERPPRQKPPKDVGSVAFAIAPAVPREDSLVALAAPFEGPARHCARMRSVEMVVDYIEGPPAAEVEIQYGAVFRASTEADEHFAAAEPPTHDAWVLSQLTGTTRGVVQLAQTFVKELLQRKANPPSAASFSNATPLGAVSAKLARLMPGVGGQGTGPGDDTGPDGGGGGGGGAGSRRKGRALGEPVLRIVDGMALVVQTVQIEDTQRAVVATAAAAVGLDGGRETSAPVGSTEPEVLGWRCDDPNHAPSWVAGPDLVVPAGVPRKWTVHVRPSAGAATQLAIRFADAPEEKRG